MRPNHTCENCIRRKRKCDRVKPACSLCRLSGFECHYQPYRHTSKHPLLPAPTSSLPSLSTNDQPHLPSSGLHYSTSSSSLPGSTSVSVDASPESLPESPPESSPESLRRSSPSLIGHTLYLTPDTAASAISIDMDKTNFITDVRGLTAPPLFDIQSHATQLMHLSPELQQLFQQQQPLSLYQGQPTTTQLHSIHHEHLLPHQQLHLCNQQLYQHSQQWPQDTPVISSPKGKSNAAAAAQESNSIRAGLEHILTTPTCTIDGNGGDGVATSLANNSTSISANSSGPVNTQNTMTTTAAAVTSLKPEAVATTCISDESTLSHAAFLSPPPQRNLAPSSLLASSITDVRSMHPSLSSTNLFLAPAGPHLDRSDALQFFFTHIRSHVTFVSEAYIFSHADQCPILSNAMVCFALAISPDTNNQKVVHSFYSEAIANIGAVIDRPTPIGILGILITAAATYHILSSKDVPRYIAIAVRLSLELKLNTELGIATFSADEDEQESLRLIWWSIVHIDRIVACGQDRKSEVNESDCLIRLPACSKPLYLNLLDQTTEIDIAVMTSPNWSVVSLPGRGLVANQLVIEKLMNRSLQFCQQINSRKLEGIELVRVRTELQSSLASWHAEAPKSITQFNIETSSTPHTSESWQPLMVVAMYNYARINLWRNLFADCVVKSQYQALTSHAAIESIQAANDLAELVAKPLINNSATSIIGPFFSLTFFAGAVCLITALNLPHSLQDATRNTASLNCLVEGLRSILRSWKSGTKELQSFDYLASLSDSSAIVQLFDILQFPKTIEILPEYMKGMENEAIQGLSTKSHSVSAKGGSSYDPISSDPSSSSMGGNAADLHLRQKNPTKPQKQQKREEKSYHSFQHIQSFSPQTSRTLPSYQESPTAAPHISLAAMNTQTAHTPSDLSLLENADFSLLSSILFIPT
ncbi:hypothetical protein BASA50_003581 [Batrachochytrium salamandrivorans]|uniref:Zn(2)-C6 fungal-type domain-containing protein n=1 Tax=Batrachochytrium salamandrivorans TaxID=1357716 RepID=A0ABQ8FKR6_9FUNG|nr:hypothetical protein BASA60_008034 [Batrachochytrium salamandrivorans]KAH6598542.1 hypothetical protein BASA50_003581 [Batrachochytrium salamandrivorans]KAH6602091.1 hypothetical protein BASA61_001460 [Batrachochytrium salamandrivorans]KAH9266591.1 hypothetical protein BASA84_001079 [Batrachochytrium salamandrivorans]KAJ1334734.1 hypothetical protein BSLG_007889 [Batrachochytrium salamandrivorans]